MISERLPEEYYLDHFLTMLEAVEARYGDLLEPAEKTFCAGFRSLARPARLLFVRLVSRRGPAFRSDALAYGEIPNLPAAAEELATRGFLAIDGPEDLAEAFLLLTAPELQALASELGHPQPRTLRKPERQEALWQAAAPRALQEAILRRYHWYLPLHQATLRLLRLLFFSAPNADLRAFVLSDLGRVRFEPYPLVSDHRLFTRRDEALRLLQMADLRQALAEAVEEGALDRVPELTAQLPPTDGHPLLMRWRRRFLEEAGRFWERQDRPATALALYADPETEPSRERRARLLAKQGWADQARDLCVTILAVPRTPEEETAALSLFRRLTPGTPAPEPPHIERLVLPGPLTGESSGWSPAPEKFSGGAVQEGPAGPGPVGFLPPERIERRVLDALAAAGRRGFHAENHFWQALFGLIFWEQIFRPVPRAFGHPFQYGPTDLFSPGFRPAREPAFSARLAAIRADDGWKTEIIELYKIKFGTAHALIWWEGLPRETFADAVGIVDRNHVAAVCDRMSRNPGGFKTGFPDLFLFGGEPWGYELAEVKSPGDRLQDNQRSWLRWFARHGIPCRVIQVAYVQPGGPSPSPLPCAPLPASGEREE